MEGQPVFARHITINICYLLLNVMMIHQAYRELEFIRLTASSAQMSPAERPPAKSGRESKQEILAERP